ncbi:hypothetical protein Smed_6209 (plasmid) [Sinorhizobium medicae WSM419]|uniref:Uncharacterized protein n=1 Tax=Sinorhizobium medicae (strain WSM419) TaxID=366394 RepID=A6UMD8_SINMW|nr:hypothetical protein Smed_6209 [Sinorhizobium medicae WSM419]
MCAFDQALRGELHAMIGDDHARFPAPFKERRHLPCHTTPGDRGVGDRCQTFARHVIDDVEHTEPPSAGELVVYEIQRPAGIGSALTRIGARVPTARRLTSVCEPKALPCGTADRRG